MNVSKHTVIISVAGIALQLFFILTSFIGNPDSFAHFWTSCGFAYWLLAFHIVTGIYAWHMMRHYPENRSSHDKSQMRH
ncbi:hypothetical protein RJO36_004055 [Enterobacter hormaechei]|nr:hypothetical protein [Enterobacter hormaechei]